MPTAAAVLGFTNPWYEGAIATATVYDLAGSPIRLVAAPYFVATKFVAFADPERGASDCYASHDLEDILAVVDDRPSLVAEIAAADKTVRSFLVKAAEGLLGSADFANALPGHVESGRDRVVLQRLREVVGE